MSAGHTRAGQAYYFVPLGRERGGYLDKLGLSPDADASSVGEKHTAYLKDAERVFKASRKALKMKLENNEITKQELEAAVAELESERTKKEQLLNELKEKYDVTVANEKRGARGAAKQSDAIWLEMIRRFDAAPEFWQLLARPRPFPNVSHALLLAVEQHWLSPHLGDGNAAAGRRTDTTTPPASLASQTARAAREIDLSLLAALATERDLLCRLVADALWSKVSYTNRGHWSAVLERWAAEVARMGPRLHPQAVAAAPPVYPNLSRATNLAIDYLQAEDMVEVDHAPKRGAPPPQRQDENLDALLALLAQQQSRTADGGADASTDERIVLEPDQLQDLLRLLEQTAAAEGDALTLADTVWEFTDSDGDVFIYEFYADGSFAFNRADFNGSGTWTQQGTRVRFSYPGSSYGRDGTISGDTMQGTGTTSSYAYTWTAVRRAR